MGRLVSIIGLLLMFISTNANAIPAFARQMGVSCNTCHSQNAYPALNRFGRSFKASGFTMVGMQNTITDDSKESFLSLTDTLNMAFVVKIRYIKSSASKSVLEFPDETALLIGGRVANDVGVFAEIGYNSADNTFGLANFKLPFIYNISDYTVGIVPYRTDGFGPAAAFEVLNTGAVRGTRVLEERTVISAQQYIGTASEAEGLGVYVYSDLWNAVYSTWLPTNGSVHDATPANYLRIAITPQIGVWDIGFGAQYWWGTAKRANDTNTTLPDIEENTDAYSIDFQAMGTINMIPVSFFITYANAKYNANSIYANSAKDKSAATILTEVAVIPKVFMLSIGYRDADSGIATSSSDNAAIVGAKYFYKENIEFQIDYTRNIDNTADKNKLLFMLYTAF
jgi:hypothetical protein